MSQPNLCRLCVSICHGGYKSLYDENGGGNSVYELAVKYFDSAFLNLEDGKHFTGICLECWGILSDFDVFKQTIFQAQSKLIEVDTQSRVVQNEVDLVHMSQSKLMDIEAQAGVIVVIDDEIHPADKGFNLEDNKRCTFPSESEFITGEFSSDYMDIIEVSLDNISNDSISPYGNSEQVCPVTGNIVEETNKSGESPLKQISCKSVIVGSQRRKSHRKINANEFITEWREKLKCVVCDEPCSSLTVLRKHFMQSHPNEECYVVCCQRKFNHFDLIEDHIRLHIDPYSFRCEVCDKCFSNSRILCEHMAKKHSEDSIRSYNCPKCKKCFHTKDRRKYHLENYCTNMCRECGRLFRTEVRRKLHERVIHNLEEPICKQCDKTFQDKHALKEHLQEHAGNSGTFMCSDCGKVVSTEWALRSHKRVHEVKNIHKCTVCKDIFRGAVPLREHMAIHTGVPTYTCSHCPMKFQYRSRLHYHRKTEHANVIVQTINQQQTYDDINQASHGSDVNQISHEMDKL